MTTWALLVPSMPTEEMNVASSQLARQPNAFDISFNSIISRPPHIPFQANRVTSNQKVVTTKPIILDTSGCLILGVAEFGTWQQ